MKTTSIFRLAAGGIILFAVCLLLPGSPALSESRQNEVQVQTEYNVGAAPTDAGRAIDMAERVAMQNQQTTQTQLMRIERKLDRLADKIDSLDQRLAGIERHLGIVPPPPPVPSSPPAPAPQPPKRAK